MTTPTPTPDQIALLRRIDEREKAGNPIVWGDIPPYSKERETLVSLPMGWVLVGKLLDNKNRDLYITPAGRAGLAEAEEK